MITAPFEAATHSAGHVANPAAPVGAELHVDSGVHAVDGYLAAERRMRDCPWMGMIFLRSSGSINPSIEESHKICEQAQVSLEKVWAALSECFHGVLSGQRSSFENKVGHSLLAIKNTTPASWMDPFVEDATPFYSYEVTIYNKNTGDVIYVNPMHLKLIRERGFFAGLDVHDVLHVLGIVVRENDPVQSILTGEQSYETPVIQTEEELGRLLNAYYHSTPEECAFFMMARWSISKDLQKSPTYRTSLVNETLGNILASRVC